MGKIDKNIVLASHEIVGDVTPFDLRIGPDMPVYPCDKSARWRGVFSRPSLRRYWIRSLAIEHDYGSIFLLKVSCFALGAAIYFSLPNEPLFFVPPALTIGLGIAVLGRYIRTGTVAPLFLLSFILILGGLFAQIETLRKSTIILDGPLTTTVSGVVERRELDFRGNWRYGVKLLTTEMPNIKRMPGYVFLTVRQSHQVFAVGDEIKGRARLSPPSGPAFVGGNDFAFDAYFNGVGASGFFYGKPERITDGSARSCWNQLLSCLDRGLYRLRAWIAAHIRETIGGDSGAFAASIITDERRAISTEAMDALRLSGLAHIVAISGLNMALAAGIFFVGMRQVLSLSQSLTEAFPIKKMSAALALVMTLCYYLISGFPVSAERAWIMTSVMLIAVILDRQAITMRNVAISALIILLISPSQVLGVSFQMSFAATIALVAVYSAWSRVRTGRIASDLPQRSLPSKIAFGALAIALTTVISSLIGGLATAPFSISYFHQFSTHGLIANLAAMPIMGLLVMPSALAAMLLMPFGFDGPLLSIMGFGMSLVLDVAYWVSGLSEEWIVGRLPAWFLPSLTLSMLAMTLFRSALAMIGLIPLALTLAVVHVFPVPTPLILIHEGGDLIVSISEQKVSTNKRKPNAFIYDQLKRAIGIPDPTNKPDIEKQTSETLGDDQKKRNLQGLVDKAKAAPGQFYCTGQIACAAKIEPIGNIVQILDPTLLGRGCDLAQIVVTPIRTRMQSCRSVAKLFSATTLRRSGTIELYADENNPNTYQTVSALDGQRRSWSRHRFYDWRADQFLGDKGASDNDE